MSHPIETPPPWLNEPYSIKRHGCAITHCDSEPIHTPGCIQAHGALLVARLGDLNIRQVSENIETWLGLAPEHLIGKPVAAAIGQLRQEWLKELIYAQPLDRNPVFAFTLFVGQDSVPLDVFVHTLDGTVILEFEPVQPDAEKRLDYYSLLKQTVGQLQTAQSILDFCRTAAHEFRVLTGLDRVMIYRFHPDHHGEVIAESKRADLDPWLGFHYPAEDIPPQAREIFEKIWIRPLQDAKAPPMELVPLVDPDTRLPADLTYCALRGASVMYTEYLQNMGVAASLTMAIRRNGRLWGLIAGHHYSVKTFAYPTRTACEFLAQVVSLLIASVEEREHLAYRLRIQNIHTQLIALASGDAGLVALTDGTPTLLDGIQASGAAIFHGGKWLRVGQVPDSKQLQDLADWLVERAEFQSAQRPVYVTDHLAHDYPDGAELAEVASGILAVSVSRTPRNLLIWFRPETIQTIDWAGNPHKLPVVQGPNGPRLSPRASFALFKESVKQRSLPWKDVELESALALRMQIMQVVVSRAEHFATLNAELYRSNEDLKTFAHVASHDLKEPLRGIHKYAYLLRESAEHLGEENRQRLDGLMRLTGRMDTLLDSLLNFSRVGQTPLDYELADLNEVLEEALEMESARREDAPTDIGVPRPLPTLNCDRLRVREIFCNLIDNALKYSDQPLRQIEIGYFLPQEASQHLSDMPAECRGHAIFYVRDNGIGIHARHYAQVFKMFKRLHGRDEYGGGTGAGLCIAKMLVERHNGRIWFDSIPGVGSTFYFSLPLNVPPLATPPG